MYISETRKRIQRHYESSPAMFDAEFDMLPKGNDRAVFDIPAQKFCKTLDLVYQAESYSFYKQVKPSLLKYGLRMYCIMNCKKTLNDSELARAQRWIQNILILKDKINEFQLAEKGVLVYLKPKMKIFESDDSDDESLPEFNKMKKSL